MASQLFKIGFKKRNSAGEHYQISLSKGFRENVAGNGPAQVTVKQRCLDRNGLFVHVGTREIAFGCILVNQIREEVLFSKFGNIIPAVHSTTLEINGVSIRTCNITYVKSLLSESDVNHIKYLNFGDLTPKDNYAVVEGKQLIISYFLTFFNASKVVKYR